MEIVKECGTSILSTIVEDLVKSTGRQVGSIFRFKSIIEDLNEEAENLRLAQENMQHRVDGAIKDTDEIEKDVEKWLRDVTAVVADAEDLEKQTREKKTCLNGLCPNWIWRYQMARRAQKKISIMSKLKDGGKFDNISHRTTLSGINVLTPKDFMPFESTTCTFNLIIEALKDDRTNVVGLYGMGGVGKTTLAKAVVNKAKEEKIFNEVMMVVVSQTANIRDIQGQLADSLNLKLQEESGEGRAERLYMRLKNEKKILIILDDIWEKIDLAVIGIPVDDHHKDCKIFLTTRQKQVCIDMGCHSRIPLDVLNEEEGLVLFKRHSGLNDDQPPTTIKLAKEVVEECKDFVLPTKLLRYVISVNDDDVASYPKSRTLKIVDIEATSLVAFKALYENVEYLELRGIKGCCQNMVPSIDETGLNKLKRLSLCRFDLEFIIDTTQQQDEASTAFFNLVDLSLWYGDGLREICSGGRPPRGFLENLETLEVFYCHSMSCLFPSWVLIQRLRKLKEVTVRWCDELEDVFQLEGLCYAKENPFLLSSLESLNLVGLKNLRYIWKVPTQQVSLQRLTVVKVIGCHKLRYLFTLREIPASLLQLEQLIVWECDSLEHIVEIKEADETVAEEGGNDVMFPKLRILQLRHLENFINFCSQNYSSTWPALQELSLYLPLNSTASFVAQLEANMLQISKKKLRVLEVGIIDQLCNTVVAQLIHGFQNLEELKIRYYRVQVLSQLELSLPSLKVLKLKYLEELECLCKGPTHLLSLLNLKKLSVWYCNRLRHMFSPSLTRNLLQLEELSIGDCGELEQIFIEDDAADMTCHREMVLPQLHKLTLQQLASLVNFCPVGYHFIFPSLSKLVVTKCPKLTTRFSVDQNRSVHAEAEALQTGKEDVDMEQSPPETTREIECWNPDSLRKHLPPYIRN
ncbi:hypothetical protein LWI29_028305 [Acer saccharum]|uniref:AAA+ ATPase domain-containing protein n=1 Tax=Acer saccharum TaxID=4024 RepID=A0AA39T8N5_ACESA|nr:hypothetical protein LWI29_028305 [Acer saccharum]